MTGKIIEYVTIQGIDYQLYESDKMFKELLSLSNGQVFRPEEKIVLTDSFEDLLDITESEIDRDYLYKFLNKHHIGYIREGKIPDLHRIYYTVIDNIKCIPIKLPPSENEESLEVILHYSDPIYKEQVMKFMKYRFPRIMLITESDYNLTQISDKIHESMENPHFQFYNHVMSEHKIIEIVYGNQFEGNLDKRNNVYLGIQECKFDYVK